MDKEQFLSALAKRQESVNEEEHELPGIGTIRVKGLTRAVFLNAQKRWPDDVLEQERYTLSHAIVEPDLTPADIKAWQEASGPEEINQVALLVNRLSGIGRDAHKEAYKSAGD